MQVSAKPCASKRRNVPLSAEREWLFRYRNEAAANFASRSAPSVGGDGMLYVADTHTLFAAPLAGAFDRGARFRQFSLGPGVIGCVDAGWDLAWHL